MGMVPIPFPLSSTPGQRSGEGEGRLINAFAEKLGSQVHYRRAPGLLPFTDTLKSTPRGHRDVNGTLYAAFENVAVTVSLIGTVTVLANALTGIQPVQWAHNNKSPTPDVVVVTENGAFSVSPTTVTSFADPDLPQPIGVTDIDGYFVFPIGDGRMFASDLNDVAVNALSFGKAEAKPDGLLRATASGGVLRLYGPASTEIWTDAGTSPFPFARQAVVSTGIIERWAVAGSELGWDGPEIFVAADGTVRRWDGYQPVRISEPPVERSIQSVVDKTTIEASVFVIAGHPFWCLSGPNWTWVYDVTTGAWHERQSYGLVRWRGSKSAKFAGKWLVGDTQSTKLQQVTEAAYKEDGAALVWIAESGPVKSFPLRMRLPSAFFDFSVGSNPSGPAEEIDPQVQVSWSLDGGATWSDPDLQLALGQEGQFNNLIRVDRLGRASHHGARFRLQVPAGVYATFRGGQMSAEPSRP